jgi:transcription antitermination factor NusG
MTEYLDNEECEYKYNEEVNITQGLYKGSKGKFKKQIIEDEETFYIIEVTIDNKLQKIKCRTNHIKKVLNFKIPFVN